MTASSTGPSIHASMHSDRRWWALMVLCLGVLMIVLDTTIVNVALPSIKTDLLFSDTALAWVVNAYMLTYGGFLLLGGRLGDLYGHRKLFLYGTSRFLRWHRSRAVSRRRNLNWSWRAACRGSVVLSSARSGYR